MDERAYLDDQSLQDSANSIRTKCGTSATGTLEELTDTLDTSAIIPSMEGTAEPEDVKTGKTYYKDNLTIKTGTAPINTEDKTVNPSYSQQSVSLNPGFMEGSITLAGFDGRKHQKTMNMITAILSEDGACLSTGQDNFHNSQSENAYRIVADIPRSEDGGLYRIENSIYKDKNTSSNVSEKVQLEYLREATSQLISGDGLNDIFDELAGGAENITSIEFSNNAAPSSAMTISTVNSELPTYATYSNGIITIYSKAKVYAGNSLQYLCYNFSNLTNISGLAYINTSNTTNMQGVFDQCTSLTDLSPIANWNTSNVTDMRYMFREDRAITNISYLANWDTSNVTNMRYMFQECASITSISSLSGWDVGEVVELAGMFYDTGITDLTPIANWDTSSATDFSAMFAHNNIGSINPIVSWDVGNALNMEDMFYFCLSLTTAYPLKSWNLTLSNGKVVNANGDEVNVTGIFVGTPFENDEKKYPDWHPYFSGYATLKTGKEVNAAIKTYAAGTAKTYEDDDAIVRNIVYSDSMPSYDYINISSTSGRPIYAYFDDNVIKIYSAFVIKMNQDSSYFIYNFSNMKSTQVDLSFLDTSDVVDMSYALSGAYINTFSFATWDTSNVTNMEGMFKGSKLLGTVHLEYFNVSNVTNMSRMFESVSSSILPLYLSNIANWDVSKVTDMSYMFYADNISDTSQFANWNVSNVRNMSYMFRCSDSLSVKIENLSDFANWNVSNVTNMIHMFSYRKRLTNISGISGWNVSNVTDMSYMFYDTGISDLTPLSLWDVKNVVMMHYMFKSCSSISDISPLANWKLNNVTNIKAIFNNCNLKDARSINTWNLINDNGTLKNSNGIEVQYLVSSTEDIFYGCDLDNIVWKYPIWHPAYSTELAMLDVGTNVNAAIKTLAAGETKSYSYIDTNVTRVAFSYTEPSAESRVDISLSTSPYRIYASWDSDNSIIYIYSTHKIKLNSDSTYLFYRFSALLSVPVFEAIDTSGANLDRGFRECTNLTDINGLANFDLTGMSIKYLFSHCENLIYLDSLHTWNITLTNGLLEFVFYHCEGLVTESLYAISNWDTSHVTSMEGLFSGCKGIERPDPISEWDVSNVTNMAQMFSSCTSLIDLSALFQWNVQSVTKLNQFLSFCTALTSLEGLGNWNTISVTETTSIFAGCTALTDISALSNWNVSNIQIAAYMFMWCGQLSNISPLASWNTQSMTETIGMFSNSKLVDITPLANWNMQSVTDASEMFYNCLRITDVSALANWRLNSVTNLRKMFAEVTRLESGRELDTWNLTNDNGTVKNANNQAVDVGSETYSMFKGTRFVNVYRKYPIWHPLYSGDATLVSGAEFNESLKTLVAGTSKGIDDQDTLITEIAYSDTTLSQSYVDVSATSGKPIYAYWNPSTGRITLYSASNIKSPQSFSYLCYNMTNLASISGLANIDTSNVYSLYGAFYDTKITNLTPLSNWNVSACQSMARLFQNGIFTNVNALSNWNIGNLRDAEQMFSCCNNLTDISGIANWNTSNITNMAEMFEGCINLSSLSSVQSWDTSKVTSMYGMFEYCQYVTTLSPLTNWSLNVITNLAKMFSNTGISTATQLNNWNLTYTSGGTVNSQGGTVNTGTSSAANGMFYSTPMATNYSQYPIWHEKYAGTAILKTGKEINAAIKTLAFGSPTTYDDNNSSVYKVITGTTAPVSSDTYVDISSSGDGPIYAIWRSSTGIIEIYSRHSIKCPSDMSNAFSNFWVLNDISGLSSFDTTNTTNLSEIFWSSDNISDISPISNWNVSNVTNMNSILSYCKILSVSALSNWNVNSLTDINWAFSDCNSLSTASPLSSWSLVNDNGTVRNAKGENVFYEQIFDDTPFETDYQKYPSWHPSYQAPPGLLETGRTVCAKMKTLANGSTKTADYNDNTIKNIEYTTSAPTGTYDTISATGSSYPIYISWDSSTKTITIHAITGGVPGKPRLNANSSQMFYAMTALEDITGLSNLDSSEVTDMSDMFKFDCNLGELTPLESWDTSNVTTMASMFKGCSSIYEYDKAFFHFNVSNVTDMDSMFYDSQMADVSSISSWTLNDDIAYLTRMFFNTNIWNATPLSRWNLVKDSEGNTRNANGAIVETTDTFEAFSGPSKNLPLWSNLHPGYGMLVPGYEFSAQIQQLAPSALSVHIDVLDGGFIPTYTSMTTVSTYDSPYTINAYCDYMDPIAQIYLCPDIGIEPVTNPPSIVLNPDCSGLCTTYNIESIEFLRDCDTSLVTDISSLMNTSNPNTDLSGADAFNSSALISINNAFNSMSDSMIMSQCASWNVYRLTDASYAFNGMINVTEARDLDHWMLTNINGTVYNMLGEEVIGVEWMFSGTGISQSSNYPIWHPYYVPATLMSAMPRLAMLGDSNDNTTTLTDGSSINSILKSLAAGTTKTVNDEDNLIKRIVMADTPLASGINISTSYEKPVYASWNSSSGTISLYSEYDIKLNSNSSWVCNNMKALEEVPAFANFDASNANTLSVFFQSCSALNSITPLANWNVSNVTTINTMFYSTGISDLTPLANWNVSNVTDMGSVFGRCTNITDISPIANWNVSNATSMSFMFFETAISNLAALANWNVSKVTDMNYMFDGCSSLSDISAIRNWNLDSIRNICWMFRSTNINGASLNNWNIYKRGGSIYNENNEAVDYTGTFDYTPMYLTYAKYPVWHPSNTPLYSLIKINYNHQLGHSFEIRKDDDTFIKSYVQLIDYVDYKSW